MTATTHPEAFVPPEQTAAAPGPVDLAAKSLEHHAPPRPGPFRRRGATDAGDGARGPALSLVQRHLTLADWYVVDREHFQKVIATRRGLERAEQRAFGPLATLAPVSVAEVAS